MSDSEEENGVARFVSAKETLGITGTSIEKVTDSDVVVIGGGPAGLAAAIAARRKGLRAAVLDCAHPPIDKACGEGLMPDGVVALSKLGIMLGPDCAFPFRGIHFYGSGVSVDAAFPSGCGFGIRRTTLHAHLVEQAEREKVSLLWGTRVTGISDDAVLLDRHSIRSRWIVGADGSTSRVRRWAQLNACRYEARRFGFRRHYRVEPWTDRLEIYWCEGWQIYVTPVGPDEVCVVVISKDPHLRLDGALEGCAELSARLKDADVMSTERGGLSASRGLKRVWRGRVALVGDAAGSVDAITGEGLRLSFDGALTLADALATGDLAGYQARHARLLRRPTLMARSMLLLERPRLRRRAMRAFASNPALFSRMLAVHVGAVPVTDFAASGLALGWRMLAA